MAYGHEALRNMDTGTIEALIRAGLPDADVEVDDMRGDGAHFSARVVCARFAGVSRIERHRMVYATLKGRIGHDIHAFQLSTSAGAAEHEGVG